MITQSWIFNLILIIIVYDTVRCQLIFEDEAGTQEFTKCGESTLVGTVSPLITDGTVSQIGNLPWHAGLYYRQQKNGEGQWEQKCGGSLITDQFILTAAHCVYNTKAADVRVALGKIHRSWDRYEFGEQKRNVSSIVYPYDFQVVTYHFDIALLLLDEKIRLGKHIMPVCIGNLGGSQYIFNKRLFVAGWGQTKNVQSGSPSDILLYTDVDFLPEKTCQKFVPSAFLLFEKFCTIKKNNTEVSVVRRGDSGGGLTVVNNGKHYIVGIVSSTLSTPSYNIQMTLFTNLSWPTHVLWVENEVRKYHSGFKWVANETANIPRGCLVPSSSAGRRFCSMDNGCAKNCSFDNYDCLLPASSRVNKVRVVCDPYFKLQGPSKEGIAICVGNTWLPSLPQCDILDIYFPPCTTSQTVVTGVDKVCRGVVIFEDNFKYLHDKWKHDVIVSDYSEFAYFTADQENSFISTNGLVIKPTILNDSFVTSGSLYLKGCTGSGPQCGYKAFLYLILPPVASARLHTRESFAFRYGIVEIRAKLPRGDWLVPEIWLEPQTRSYGQGYKSGRIRLVMNRGNDDFKCNGVDFGSNFLESRVEMGSEDNVRNLSYRKQLPAYSSFHNYKLKWTPDKISFWVDDEEPQDLLIEQEKRLCEIVGFNYTECLVWSSGSKIAPFDQNFYFSLGLTVGHYMDFPDECTNKGKPKPWKNDNVKRMVKFWEDKENWLGTWTEEGSSLYIEHIRVTAL